MIGAIIGTLSLAIWIGLLVANGGFWRARERDTRDQPAPPARWPSVVAVVPARDEADVIAESIASLVGQDYPGAFRVILVDDGSSDGTAAIARQAVARQAVAWGNAADRLDIRAAADRLEIRAGAPLAAGWTGKLWAVAQGVAAVEDGAAEDGGAETAAAGAGAAGTPDYLWLTDADIAHAPDTLRSLVARAEARQLVLVSLMAKLRCRSLAERALIPAFVFFFQKLYPFARVNAAHGIGAAAGGCMLVRRDALARAGGIAAIRGALIDDCAFGAMMKREGRIWLGLTDRSRSIRAYDDVGTVAQMITRSAYAQLGYRPIALAGAMIGLALVYGAPPLLTTFGHGWAQGSGLLAWLLMTIAFQPMLHFYRRSPVWGAALPAIAAFYAGCTLLSAWRHRQGRGGMWKGRAQAAIGR